MIEENSEVYWKYWDLKTLYILHKIKSYYLITCKAQICFIDYLIVC